MESADLSMYVMLPAAKMGVRIYFQAPSTLDVYTYFAPLPNWSPVLLGTL